ncbi:ferredoxin reductase-like C-terminal NADP-linked domain-containing protein [Mycena sanguinolenta]|nr:ferredoxin reductase-like C-terminal NADP-linked domain-containing protein [Mycena sanguinolenta]
MFSRPRVVSLVGVAGTGAAVAYLFWPEKTRHAPTVDDASLSPSHFTRATLTESRQSGPNTKLLVLTVPGFAKSKQNASQMAPIWSVYIKDDDIQVERPYTPLEGIDEHGQMHFWIKKYPKGEVARWLHSKKVGDQVEFRGPLSTWAWEEDAWDEIVMISGGTGITPFYQLLHSSFSEGVDSKTRFTLLHSSPTPSELPPPEILGRLRAYAKAHPEKFALHLFVDSRDGDRPADLPSLEVGRIQKPTIERCLGLKPFSPWRNLFAQAPQKTPRKTLFLVCGPEPMINAIAGPYGRNFSQGPIGGVLGELGYTSSEVRKL